MSNSQLVVNKSIRMKIQVSNDKENIESSLPEELTCSSCERRQPALPHLHQRRKICHLYDMMRTTMHCTLYSAGVGHCISTRVTSSGFNVNQHNEPIWHGTEWFSLLSGLRDACQTIMSKSGAAQRNTVRQLKGNNECWRKYSDLLLQKKY